MSWFTRSQRADQPPGWTPAYPWAGEHPPWAVYAPTLPAPARDRVRELNDSFPSSRVRNRQSRLLKELGEDVIETGSLPIWRICHRDGRILPLLEHGHVDDEYRQEFQRAWSTCREAWRRARPVAGLVDLYQLNDTLATALWDIAVLLRSAGQLRDHEPQAEQAFEALAAQVHERIDELATLAEELTRLEKKAGADPVAASDRVAQALTEATVLDEHRPTRELTTRIQELASTLHLATSDPDIPRNEVQALTDPPDGSPGHPWRGVRLTGVLMYTPSEPLPGLSQDAPPYPAGTRAVAIICPDCGGATGLVITWPEPIPTDITYAPTRMWCPEGHRWEDTLPVGMLRMLDQRAGPPPLGQTP